MIYQPVLPEQPLTQGDILDDCSLRSWETTPDGLKMIELSQRVLVLTQACDLAQAKTSRVVVAVLHEAHALVEQACWLRL